MTTTRTTEELLVEEKRLREGIEKKHGKSPEDLYREREGRLRDAVELKEPDRVPVHLRFNFFPPAYVKGLTIADRYRNIGPWREACKKIIIDFEADLYGVTTAADGISGEALSILEPTGYKWAGGGLPDNAINQVIETEPMKADEYDLFISDPGDFILRYYLPRTWKALAPLAKLPPLQSLVGASTLAGQAHRFSSTEVFKAFEALFAAGRAQDRYRQTNQASRTFEDEMADLGFPPETQPGGAGFVPFDTIADNLRQLRGAMADIYQRPEKLLAACERLWEWRLARGVAAADPKKRGNPKIVMGGGTHHGCDGFLSRKQFETFFWPFWKRALLKNIELGFVSSCGHQGFWDSRLEYFLEIPKGKVVFHVGETDPAKAKEILGGHHCIMGGVPMILMQSGSPQEVEEYVKRLIKTCGKGGGYIVSTSAGLTNEAKPANVRAMIDTVKKYGWY
ncbi:MAG: hypothetical protein HY663_05490 [Chloroflexi bacterium]|nr:hypothetical protein [Chloroflexota bacterium]